MRATNKWNAVLMAGAVLAVPMLMYGAVGPPQPKTMGDQVRHQILTLPYYGVFDNLAYSVDGNTVTLSGQVTQPFLKDEAVNAVKGIPGVELVNDQIEVLPLSSTDDHIRWRTYIAIYGYGPLTRYAEGSQPPIRIIVKNGHVTLKGVVLNKMDRQLAYMRANSVPGVFSVTNDLQVEQS